MEWHTINTKVIGEASGAGAGGGGWVAGHSRRFHSREAQRGGQVRALIRHMSSQRELSHPPDFVLRPGRSTRSLDSVSLSLCYLQEPGIWGLGLGGRVGRLGPWGVMQLLSK